MNERIQELAVQASKHVSATVPFDDPSYAELGKLLASQDNTVLNAFKEKFAELIVAECIDIVGIGGEFASRPKLVEKLQEHFGVEE